MAAPCITMPKRNRMRKLRAEGLNYAAIARVEGVSQTSARRHTRSVATAAVSHIGRHSAMRMELWFARCNRVLAEVRA